MESLSNFDAMYDFFDKFRVNRIAEFREPIGFKTKTEYFKAETKAHFKSFMRVMNCLLTDAERYSQNKGPIVLEWLDLLEKLVSATEGIIKMGLESAVQDDDEDVARALRFSVDSMLGIIKLAKRKIKKKRGRLRRRYSLAREVREDTLVFLANVFYYLMVMLLASVKVQKREKEPELILEVTGKAFYRLKHF